MFFHSASDIWLGLTDRAASGVWTLADGQIATYFNWGSNGNLALNIKMLAIRQSSGYLVLNIKKLTNRQSSGYLVLNIEKLTIRQSSGY